MGSFPHARSLADTPARPRERLQRYLASRRLTPKQLAQELSTDETPVSPKAAENLLAGHWPGDLTMAAIVRRFGAGVWNAVFLPEAEPEIAALLEREGKLRAELARMQARRIEMGAFRPPLAHRPARMEDAS